MFSMKIAVLLSTMAVAVAQVVQYDFPCLGSRSRPIFPDSVGSNYLGNLRDLSNGDGFECSPFGTGITPRYPYNTGRGLVSQKPVKDLKSHFMQAPGVGAITYEFWLTPAPTTDGLEIPIFAVAREGFMDYDCKQFQFLVEQNNTDLYMTFDMGDYCDGFPVRMEPKLGSSEEPLGLTHVTLAFGSGRIAAYVNAEEIFDIAHVYNAKQNHWVNENRLRFFPGEFPWYGSIHRFAIHDQYLTGTRVMNAYNEGKAFLRDAKNPQTAPPVVIDAATPAPITVIDAATTTPITGHETTPAPTAGNTATTTAPRDTMIPAVPEVPEVKGLPTSADLAVKTTMTVVFQGQDVTGPVKLSAQSELSPEDSNGWWVLKAEILSLPGIGDLFTLENEPIQKGHLVDLFWSEEKLYAALVKYTLDDAEYFSVPFFEGETISENFWYRIVVVDEKTQDVIQWSQGAQQVISVLRVNRPTSVDTSGAQFVREDKKAYLQGRVTATDADVLEPEQVRVEVSATNGTLSLNLTFLEIPEDCQMRSWSLWQCSRDGESRRHIDFLAYPSEIEQILQGLEYKYDRKSNDEISIRVFDGEGGDCLSRQEQLPLKNEDGELLEPSEDRCYTTLAVIPIIGWEEKNFLETLAESTGTKGNPLILGVLIGGSLAVVFALCIGIFAGRRCAASGNIKKAPVDNDQDQDSVAAIPDGRADIDIQPRGKASADVQEPEEKV